MPKTPIGTAATAALAANRMSSTHVGGHVMTVNDTLAAETGSSKSNTTCTQAQVVGGVKGDGVKPQQHHVTIVDGGVQRNSNSAASTAEHIHPARKNSKEASRNLSSFPLQLATGTTTC